MNTHANLSVTRYFALMRDGKIPDKTTAIVCLVEHSYRNIRRVSTVSTFGFYRNRLIATVTAITP